MGALSPSHPHPVGADNPVTMRALAALPAAGAWDAAPTEVACAGFWWARPYVIYHRGGVNGSMDYHWDISPYSVDQAGVQNWFHQTLYVPVTLTPCKDARSMAQRETVNYCATTGNAETFVGPPIHLAGCVERIRIACREVGNQAAPGQAFVIAVFYVEG